MKLHILQKYILKIIFLNCIVQGVSHELHTLCVFRAQTPRSKDSRLGFASSPVQANHREEGG